jgi:DNA-binding NarL/FixJ family response regulator
VNTTIRCIVCDEYELLRVGVTNLFAAEPDLVVVGEAATGEGALALIEAELPDVAVVGIGLPDRDGVEVCREVTARELPTQVVLFTRTSDPTVLDAGLAAGARGYVLKSSPPADLVRAVRAAQARRTYVDSELAGALLQRETGVRLSRREHEVIRLLSHGMTTNAIGETLFLSPATIRTYIETAMRKLDARNRVHAVAVGLRKGLIE